MPKIFIAGAGPAGLTAAYELLKLNKCKGEPDKYIVTILEETDCIGGISKTVNYKGNRMDMGGHRFFSKVQRVNDWWEKILPLQGSMPKDDIQLGRVSAVKEGGPDPEETDKVMLKRNRLSRIYFDGKFFDYPISLKFNTFRNMGLLTTITSGCSYIHAMFNKRPDDTLENFFINRFGKKVYSMFFESYTTNLWGRHPSKISADWGAQRVKGVSVSAVLKDAFEKLFHVKNRKVETSLIEEFAYPKLGPGELWEEVARKIVELGGEIKFNSKVVRINLNELCDKVTSIAYIQNHDSYILEDCDIFLSSMPIKDLVEGMGSVVPSDKLEIASGLPYRDYITVGVLLKDMAIRNQTKTPTINNILPDNWIYVHDKRVNMCRIQVYNNWSPYMVKDLEHTIWLGLEYFCNEYDEMWEMSEESFTEMASKELETMGLIQGQDDIIDTHVEKVRKAYPAYFDTYDRFSELRVYLDSIQNLYCIGRNGQHKYNNMDHSMCTSFEAVNCIEQGILDKSSIWNVNTEQEYSESVSK